MGLPPLKDTYSDDPYIVDLAKAQTPCFGLKFEVADETCRSCPLAASCQENHYERMANAARSVEEHPNGGPPPAGGVAAAIPESRPGDTKKIRRFAAFADTLCCVCGEKIPEKTDACHHIRDGFFHEECREEYLQGKRKV